jgi:hypothetical protein
MHRAAPPLVEEGDSIPRSMADVIAESVVGIPAPPVREHVARYIGFR